VAELLAGSFERSWGDEALRSALSGSSARVVVAVDGAERVVGVVLARRVADLLEIDQVGVLPSDRRRGAAAALLIALLDSARVDGACEARLELAAGNTAALRLYEGLGFVVVGRRARYYPDGDDALLLTLEL
jgi:ribosomal-protein-alanine N-acetyltransferase